MTSKGIHWRGMTTLDLPAVQAIAACVHPSFPEDLAVFAERRALYPDGAWLLDINGAPSGYFLTHPWTAGTMPKLNQLYGTLPSGPPTYYLHDLALLPQARGHGAAGVIVEQVLDHARRAGFATASLAAVNGSAPFWSRHGFVPVDVPELREALLSYEDAAQYMVRQLS
ncbi:GNAT family N-acetyltransferase [Devosia sp. 1566]|uniref:GNAT family N-acetyltransferase n=1 Tax=Devosia sp. 1566 TaxID=2499144 RepID=UPI0020BDAFDE|nr:GNAT family N-acetyltransferase [Devosia sp. 1566]